MYDSKGAQVKGMQSLGQYKNEGLKGCLLSSSLPCHEEHDNQSQEEYQRLILFRASYLRPRHCPVIGEGAIAQILATVGQECERPVHLLQCSGVAGGDVRDESPEVPGCSIGGLVVGVYCKSVQLSI